MRVPIKFIVLVGLYISVKGTKEELFQSDPIAREISTILKNTVNCNVIIASDNQLEHLNENNEVPVLIYDHSECRRGNIKWCLHSQQKVPRWLTRPCTKIIVVIDDQATFIKEWNSHEEDDDYDVEYDSSFPSELWKAGLQFTSSYNDISYFLLSIYSGGPNYRKGLISSKPSKTRSLNLFAVDVGNHRIPSKHYFMCQFCDNFCDGFKEIFLEPDTFLNDERRSNFIKPYALNTRTWHLDGENVGISDDKVGDDNWSHFEETLHRKSSGASLSRMRSLKKLLVAEMLFQGTGNKVQRYQSKCRMSRVSIDNLWWDIDPRLPGNKVIWSGSSSFTFLTCHTEIGDIEFDTYITPFDLPTWIGIMVASLVTHFVFATFAWRDNIRPIYQFSFSHIILSWLFSFSYSPSKSISKHFWYRVISVAWFFASFVLGMMYTSYAISGVTRPLPGENVSTFEELTSFRVCRNNTCEEYEVRNFMESNGTRDEGWSFDIYSTPISGANLTQYSLENTTFGEKIYGFKRYYDKNKNYTEWWKDFEISRFLNLMLPMVFHETKGPNVNAMQSKDPLLAMIAEIEKEIVKCQKKAYADSTESVLEEHDYLSKHYPWLKFRVSEEREFWSQYYMVFERDFGSRMSKTYSALVESGILSHLEKSYRNVVNQKRFKQTLKNKEAFTEKEKSEFQPSNMRGNIVTIFIVYFIMVTLALVVFLIEKTWIPALLTVIRWFYTMEMYINVALVSLEVFMLRLRYPRNRR
jgi:hypothetical protein